MKLSSSPNRIKIAVADDHYFFRKGLVAFLANDKDFQVVDHGADGKELIKIVEKHLPDVVLVDIEMPVMNGLEATRYISKKFPQIIIIVLTMHDQDEIINQLLKAGAKGFLTKNTDEREVKKAITNIQEHGAYFCNHIMSKVMQQKSNRLFNKYGLTDREINVMKFICNQLSSKEIAERMKITPRAVDSAKERIQNKTGVKTNVGIALFAIKEMYVLLSEILN